MNRIRIEHARIVSFGSRWNDVLPQLGLPRVTAGDSTNQVRRIFGAGGESLQHKNFKEYVRQHPEIVGAGGHWEVFVEYPLPSGDQIDVVFKSPKAWIAVEVKASISNRYPFDYERGLYQIIKYGAILKAMAATGDYSIPSTVECVLVLESILPPQYIRLALVLGIKFFEAVRTE